jgi:hypothetical protein
MGWQALQSNTIGNFNTANGLQALSQNTTGSDNTANGGITLFFNSTGSGNTATGLQSLFFNTTGSQNMASGIQSLYYNSSGNNNTADGRRALFTNTTGSNNTALGDSADVAFGNLTNATALGYHAIVRQSNSIQLGNNAVTTVFAGVGNAATIVTGGLQVTGGSPGVGKVLTSNALGVATWQLPAAAIPSWSLTGNAGTVDGTNFIGTTDNVPLNIRVNNQKAGRIESNVNTANTFFGYLSGSLNSNGGYNTAIGYSTLASSTGSSGNTATGAFALSANTNAGNYNSAFGGEALTSNIGGSANTAIGNSAMLNNRNGRMNTAIGVEALRNNIGGGRNTAVGIASLLNNDAGNFNTAIGNFSLATNISGDYNSAVGYNAGVGGINFTNATAIGANATATASNRIRIGDGAILRIEANQPITVTSDGRFKNNVSEKDVKGIEFIKKLRPVVYNFDGEKYTNFVTKNMPDSIRKSFLKKDFSTANNTRQSGFIAQEVEKAAKESGYNFSGVYAPENENDNYSIAYSTFVVPLVKAMQEQQVMIEKLQKEVEELKKTPAADLKVNTETVELSDNNNIVLNQNVPNPFAQQTSISYNIPAAAASAQILFYGMDGRLMKTANLIGKGKGVLNVYANDLSNGSYMYSLVVDGKLIDTKKLVKQ